MLYQIIRRRIILDGGIIYALSDIIIDRHYRRRGFADILDHKDQFVDLSTNQCGMLRNQFE